MTTGTPGDSATLGGELCPDIYRPRLTGSEVAVGGVGVGRSHVSCCICVLPQEVDCLWSWTQGAHRRVGDSVAISPVVSAWYAGCWAPGTGRQAGDFSREQPVLQGRAQGETV